ncbi:MAG: helix-turn-helix domain-containing protein [Thermoleophilia bacterium]
MIYEHALTVEEMARLAQLRRLLASGEAERVRIAAGVNRAEAAKTCGVQAVTLIRWETGRTTPKTRRALAYLHLLEMLSDAALNPRETSGPTWPD